MKIYLIRFIVILWVLALLASCVGLIAWLIGGEVLYALGAFISVFAISGCIITIFSFLTLGIVDPRKVLEMLKSNV